MALLHSVLPNYQSGIVPEFSTTCFYWLLSDLRPLHKGNFQNKVLYSLIKQFLFLLVGIFNL